MPEAGEPEQEEKASARAAHLVDLADGWMLWRTIGLRGAGFPVHMLESLAADDAAAAIDDFLDCEAARDEARDRALRSCRDAVKTVKKEARKPYYHAIRHLTKGRVPEPIPDAPETAPLFEALALAAEKRDVAERRAKDSIAEGMLRISADLREVCQAPLFREAIIWQNRQALHTSIDVLARIPAGKRTSNIRRREQLVVNYLHRYGAKNETIGFFGPAGWARFVDRGPAIAVEPGPKLVSARELHFEYWAIDVLADVLSRDQDVLPWLAPRLDPNFRVDGETLYLPNGKPQPLSGKAAHTLAACDGETPAGAIAARLAADPQNGFDSPAHVLRLLGELAKRRVIFWNAHVPVTPYADRALRRTLERIRDPAVRKRTIASLAELETGKAAVGAARGDPAALDAAMADLEARFQRVTGREPTRKAGKTYAGRTIVYEDCRRDVDVALGPELRRRLGPPLSLVLRGASWYVHAVGSRFAEYLEELFAKVHSQSDSSTVGFDSLIMRNRDAWKAGNAIVGDVLQEHQRRWMSVIGFEEDVRSIQLSAADIHDRVCALFPESPSPWPQARYHNPDLMIAAEGAEDIRAGRFQFVLGELHAGHNPLAQPWYNLLHPNPEDITRFVDHDLQRPLVLTVTARQFVGTRMSRDSLSPRDFHITTDDAPSWRPKEQVIPVSDMVVEKSDCGLVVRSRDGARRFHVAEFFRIILGPTSTRQFSMFPAATHRPRITLDQLVLSREQWRFPCGEVPFAALRSTEERFIGARRWTRTHGIPRWMFARVSFEMKPVYVDFESPVSVDVLAKFLRRGAKESSEMLVTVTEMLPTPRQCWLTDAEGKRYTSELRVIAVNPQPWRPPESASPQSA